MTRPLAPAVLTFLIAASSLLAQPANAPKPSLRLEAGGPTSYIKAVVFSPDGQTLYVAGFDKVIHVWKRNAQGRFVRDLDRPAYRVPLGPGTTGSINALAVSPDGKWLAAGGVFPMTGEASFADTAFHVDNNAITPAMWAERGAIYLFNLQPAANEPLIRQLQGHRGSVVALAFAAGTDRPVLVSAAHEREPETPGNVDGMVGRVRLWDFTRGPNSRLCRVPFSRIAGPQPQPGLACWSSGPQLQVAIAWGGPERRLHHWDVTTGRVTPHELGEKSLYYNSAAYAAGQLFIGAWDAANDRRGHLRRLDPQRFSEVPPASPSLHLKAGVPYLQPAALNLLARGEDAAPTHAALLCEGPRRNDGRASYWLYFADLANRRNDQAYELPDDLCAGELPPVMTASLPGNILAVAGGRDHAIWLYDLAGFLGGAPQAPVELKQVSSGIRDAAFLSRGDDVALVLSSTVKPRPGPATAPPAEGLHFDFSARRLRPYAPGDGWTWSSPTPLGWRIALNEATQTLTWTGPGGRQGTLSLQLGPGESVTDFAVLPPVRPRTQPILAVATWNVALGDPALRLYDAGTGSLFRNCRGHAARIRALAATADGRLLASSGDDEQVCVWSMADADKIIGQHGAIGFGLSQEAADKPLQVTQTGEDRANLRVGDSIESIVFKPGAPPRKFRLLANLLNEIWSATRPGDTLELQVKRGDQDVKVPVQVIQGIDDRKPLLTLFVTRPFARTGREWIAWTSAGPYDCSSERAERYLGWHTNLGKPEEPVSFAGADQYRQLFYKPGLMKPTLAKGELVLDVPRLPPPSLALLEVLDDRRALQPDAQARVRLSQPAGTLRFRLRGPELGRDEVRSVTVTVAGKSEPLNLSLRDGETLSHAFTLPRPREDFVATIRVETEEPLPQQLVESVTLRWQPAPPTVTTPQPLPASLEGDQLPFAAIVTPVKGQAARTTLTLNGQELPLEDANAQRIARMLTLREGENVVQLTAVNRDALPATVAEETEKKEWVVRYRKKDTLQLTLTRVETKGRSASSATLKPSARHLQEYQEIRVHSPRVVVQGQVEASGPLRAVQLNDRNLQGFQPSKEATFRITTELTLQPGPNRFTFAAQTERGQKDNRVLTLHYAPQLPSFSLAPLKKVMLDTEEGPEVTLAARVELADDRQPFKGQVVVNGSKVEEFTEANLKPEEAAADSGAAAWQTIVRLRPGKNTIQVKLANDWGVEETREQEAEYLCPPRVVAARSLQGEDAGDRPAVDLEVKVASWYPPQKLHVGAAEVPGVLQGLPTYDASLQNLVWRYRIEHLPLSHGRNELEVSARNLDGSARQSLKVPVTTNLMRAFLPQMSWMPAWIPETTRGGPGVGAELPTWSALPTQEYAVGSRNYPFRLRVRAEKHPVTRLTVILNEERAHQLTREQLEMVLDDIAFGGTQRTREALPLLLKPGPNKIRVEAENEAGVTAHQWTVSCKLPENRLEIVDLPPNGRLHAETDQIQVNGFVGWDTTDQYRLIEANLAHVPVYVNGYRQVAIEPLETDMQNRRKHFRMTLSLSRKQGNLVQIDASNKLGLRQGQRTAFLVDCTQPREQRTLHLLIVDAGSGRPGAKGAGDDIRLQVTRALELKAAEPNKGLQTPAYPRVVVHPLASDSERAIRALTGYVTEGEVEAALEELVEVVNQKRDPNAVVLVYWRGRETHLNGNVCLPASDSPPNRFTYNLMTLDKLVGTCDKMVGAQVLMFDVAGRPEEIDISKTRSAVLRHAGVQPQPTLPLLDALRQAKPGQAGLKTVRDVAAAAAQLAETAPQKTVFQANLPKDPPDPVEEVPLR